MGRKATFNDPARQIVQTVEDQHKYDTPTFRRLQVNAQPVNMFVQPDYVSQASSLQLALAEAMPSLLTASQNAARVANQDEGDAGKAAYLADGGIDPEKSERLKWYSSSGFKEGYWGTYGLEKGQVGKEKIMADWDADPNRNSMPTNEWVANWYKTNTAGMNSYALNAFTREVAPVAMKLSNQGALEKINDVEAAVYKQRFDVLTNDWKAGTWSPEQAKKRQDELGMSNTDFDTLQVRVLDQFARQGDHPEAAALALKTMLENRPDGTPGIAFKSSIVKSGWVEQMGTQINQWANAKTTAQEAADRTGRSEAAKIVIDDAERKATSGNLSAATKALKTAYDNNTISFKTFLAKQQELQQIHHALKLGDGEGGGAKMDTKGFNNLYADASDGSMTPAQANKLFREQKISKSQYDQLLGAQGRYNSSENAIFKTSEYGRAASMISSFGNTKGITVDETNYIGVRASQARAAFADWAAANPDKKDQFEDKARTMIETERKFIRDNSVNDNNVFQKNYYPKYRTPQEAYEAINVKKTETDPYVLANEKRYWDWRATNPQPQTRKQ